MPAGRLKHFGWGREGDGLSAAEEAFVLGRYRARFGVDDFDEVRPPPLADTITEWPASEPLERACRKG